MPQNIYKRALKANNIGQYKQCKALQQDVKKWSYEEVAKNLFQDFKMDKHVHLQNLVHLHTCIALFKDQLH